MHATNNRTIVHKIADLIDEEVLGGFGFGQAHFLVIGVFGREELVEDVVISLDLQLESHARLLEKVSFDVGSRDLTLLSEVNTDELTLEGKKRIENDKYDLRSCGMNEIVTCYMFYLRNASL